MRPPAVPVPVRSENAFEPYRIFWVPPGVRLKLRTLTRYVLSICRSVSMAFQPPPNPRKVMFSSLLLRPTFRFGGNTETVMLFDSHSLPVIRNARVASNRDWTASECCCHVSIFHLH